MNQPQEKFITVNSHKIAYLEQGEGSPIILIHGIPTYNILWRKIMPEISKTYKVFAPDMLNYGDSDKPVDTNVSIGAQSRLIKAFMDKLNLESADIVGHDIGGGVAQLMAVNYPERVRRLVLIDSVCFDSWPIPEFIKLQEEGIEDKMSFEEFLKMMRELMPRGVHNKSAMTDDVIELYLIPWSRKDNRKALLRNILRLNPEYTQAIAGELKHIPHETLVLWGEHDEFQKPSYATKLAETIPKTSLVWIKKAGHWPMEEKPDDVIHYLMSFLNKL